MALEVRGNPWWYCNFHLIRPSNEDSLKLDGAVLLLGVYNSNSKHLVGVGLVPCKDIPILGEQRLLNETGPKRLRRDITLTQIVVTNRLLYRELAARHSHDHEAGRFFRYLRKKLHMDITSWQSTWTVSTCRSSLFPGRPACVTTTNSWLRIFPYS